MKNFLLGLAVLMISLSLHAQGNSGKVKIKDTIWQHVYLTDTVKSTYKKVDTVRFEYARYDTVTKLYEKADTSRPLYYVKETIYDTLYTPRKATGAFNYDFMSDTTISNEVRAKYPAMAAALDRNEKEAKAFFAATDGKGLSDTLGIVVPGSNVKVITSYSLEGKKVKIMLPFSDYNKALVDPLIKSNASSAVVQMGPKIITLEVSSSNTNQTKALKIVNQANLNLAKNR